MNFCRPALTFLVWRFSFCLINTCIVLLGLKLMFYNSNPLNAIYSTHAFKICVCPDRKWYECDFKIFNCLFHRFCTRSGLVGSALGTCRCFYLSWVRTSQKWMLSFTWYWLHVRTLTETLLDRCFFLFLFPGLTTVNSYI